MTLQDEVKDFFSMASAEAKYNIPTLDAIFFHGSYTRSEIFDDIDIMPVMSALCKNVEELRSKALLDTQKFEALMQHHKTWGIPEIHIQKYWGIVQNTEGLHLEIEDLEKELKQLEEQIRGYYRYYDGFNKLDSSSRIGHGISKPPADFRISPAHTIWIEREKSVRSLCFPDLVENLLTTINAEYDEEIATYAERAKSWGITA